MPISSRPASVRELEALIAAECSPLAPETIPLAAAVAGRMLASPILATGDIPRFRRAMMDGFAILASDIATASDAAPVELAIVGEVLPAAGCNVDLGPGQAIRIMTGAMVPASATAVVPIEEVEACAATVRLRRPIPVGKHIAEPGEDLRAGALVLPAGRRLRPQDVALLATLGCTSVEVTRLPRVRIIATGDELVSLGTSPHGTQVVDANTPLLEALVRRDGGLPLLSGIIPDDRAAIRAALAVSPGQEDTPDLIVIAGGSSAGDEDFVWQVVAAEGELIYRGVAMRPGGPTSLGRLAGRLVVILPGQPVACLVAYDRFVAPAIQRLSGRQPVWPYSRMRCALAEPIRSSRGRTDYIRLRIEGSHAWPLPGGAGRLSVTSQADGFLWIEEEIETLPAGAIVDVFRYDLDAAQESH